MTQDAIKPPGQPAASGEWRQLWVGYSASFQAGIVLR
jgi:hypothetical protein